MVKALGISIIDKRPKGRLRKMESYAIGIIKMCSYYYLVDSTQRQLLANS